MGYYSIYYDVVIANLRALHSKSTITLFCNFHKKIKVGSIINL
jgi:hypothetical protein